MIFDYHQPPSLLLLVVLCLLPIHCMKSMLNKYVAIEYSFQIGSTNHFVSQAFIQEIISLDRRKVGSK